MDFKKYIDFEFYSVTETTRTGKIEKIRLPSIPCNEIDLLKGDPNLKFLSVCIEFRSPVEIG